MAEGTDFKPTEKHQTSLGDIVDQASGVTVYGKVVGDLPPTSQGHRFAQLFGYKQNHQCTKLPSPIMLALPDPDGPADDCGWDPAQFVKWQMAASFATTQLHVQPVALSHALNAFPPPPVRLTTAQISTIIKNSIQAVVGSIPPLNPSQSLQFLGIFTPQQVAVLTANIISNVASLGFTLSGSALSSVSSSSTISDLALAISGATPNE